nr:histidine kinase [Prevotella sp.]
DKIGDSTRNEVQQMRTADILTRLAEDTIRLHHQLQLEQSQLKYTQTRTMVWGISALLVIVILAWFLYYNNQRKRRLQQQLNIQTLRLSNVRQRVSPHFVFNVLNSRIANTNPEETDQLMMLARLIRTNLDLTGKNVVTLAEELDFVKQYVAIERQLIGEEFMFDINAPAQNILEQIRIPSMLIQILVENAILHGLKNKEGQKLLTIHVETDDQNTRISVIDNGPGFDIRQYNSNRSRTGLHIIRSTVSILNHENPQAHMHFDIKNDHGCHAILTIPRTIKYLTI